MMRTAGAAANKALHTIAAAPHAGRPNQSQHRQQSVAKSTTSRTDRRNRCVVVPSAAAAASTAAVSQQHVMLGSSRRRHRRRSTSTSWRSIVLHVAALAVACLAGGSLLAATGGGQSRRHRLAAASAPASSSATDASPTQHLLVAVAPLRQRSPFGATWGEVLGHMAQRLAWTDPRLKLAVHDSEGAEAAAAAVALRSDLQRAQVALALGVGDPASADALAQLLLAGGGGTAAAAAAPPTFVALGSAPALAGAVRLGGRPALREGSGDGGLAALVQRLLPNQAAKLDAQVLTTVEELYQRTSSDDLLFVLLVLTNSYIMEIPEVAMGFKQRNAGLENLQCMATKCGGEILSCVTDATCKTALDCLQGCSFNDQVCSYRCITSYESPKLEAFSLCIIQKHNCFGLSAEIPMVPDPAPLATWRGAPLTHEAAEDLFIGWLREDATSALLPTLLREAGGDGASSSSGGSGGGEAYSWRVFAGKSAAYDTFPNQLQLFYRGKGRGGMWYDPVFQVKTLDGRTVWRRRHYRVKRDRVPGAFRLSVLDNGVTSSEFWRILDCEEGAEWCVFYYSGAASRAGLSYSGAILASRSGEWPASAGARARIEAALDRAGIKPWELANVTNTDVPDAPLDPSLLALA